MGTPYAEVIGDPIGHSKSPLIHKFWLKKVGIDADYRRCEVTAADLPGYLSGRSDDPDWRGCNVTLPHKQAVMPFIAWLDSRAERAEAVNTIVPGPDGRRRGFNTDVRAVTELLSRFQKADYENHVATYVQIIGAGGAARAAVIGAVDAGYGDLEFFNRTAEKARQMAAWLGLAPDAYGSPLEAIGPIRNPDDGARDQRYSHVVINATSLGMLGNEAVPMDLGRYYPDTVIFDMAYDLSDTELVRRARQLGMRAVDGLEMLVSQAAQAFEMFFGVPAPREHDDELRGLLTR